MIQKYGLEGDDVNIFDWKSPGLGRHVTFCFVQAAVYFVLVFLLESNVIRRLLQSAVSRAMAKQASSSQQRDGVTQQVRAAACVCVCVCDVILDIVTTWLLF